jgi:transcriptional regulator with XRE-family HTH domain
MGENYGPSPVVQRRQLRAELRRIRQQANQTCEQVAVAMDWSLSKLIRIESGTVGISTNDLKLLLSHYGIVDNDRVNELVALAKGANKQSPWWKEYSNIASSGLLQVIDYESAATIVKSFDLLLIPGLLQTEEYAREVIMELSGQLPIDRLNSLVALRMKRQELLNRTGPPPWFFFVLDESAIRRTVGGSDIMDSQVRHLIELASKDTVTIEIVPFSARFHRGMNVPFVIHEFSEVEDGVLYLTSLWYDSIFHGDQEEILTYREIFEELRHISLGEGSVEFLRGLLNETK